MHSSSHRLAPGDRSTAFTELDAELAAFCHDGLVQLDGDLARHAVPRGSWDDCVLSYRRGAAGSVRRDRRGRVRSAFTALWDAGRITDEEVAARVAGELLRRAAARSFAALTPPDRAARFHCCPDNAVRRACGGL
jgi:hypothetical protein